MEEGGLEGLGERVRFRVWGRDRDIEFRKVELFYLDVGRGYRLKGFWWGFVV